MFNRVYSIIDLIIHPGKHNTTHQARRICPVSGLDISMQTPNSKFLSYSGVKWYYEHKRTIYKKLLEPRLTDFWQGSPLDVQFREIAHAIRNSDSNPRNSTKRAVNRLLHDKDTLFDNTLLIDKNKLKQVGLQVRQM